MRPEYLAHDTQWPWHSMNGVWVWMGHFEEEINCRCHKTASYLTLQQTQP